MLKEFDLDAPTLSKAEREMFRLQTRCISAMYERYFAPFPECSLYWKLLIEVVPSIARPTPRNLLNVLTLQIADNPQLFCALSSREKKERALRWIIVGAKSAAANLGWPVRPFIQAADLVLEADFNNVWTWKKQYSKSRALCAEIRVEHDLDETRIKAVFSKPEGALVKEVTLHRTEPTEFAFIPCLGKLKWLDNSAIRLSAKSGVESWDAVCDKQ